LPHFETVARETPGNAEAQVSLAAAYLSSGDLDAADAALNASLRTAPDLSSAHALKACSLLKRNEPLLAARELRQSGLLEAKPPVAPWIRLVLADLDCRPERFR
jgi:Tfp pilus assembly protein PilF